MVKGETSVSSSGRGIGRIGRGLAGERRAKKHGGGSSSGWGDYECWEYY
ncbi:MAG: hypothetical protein J6331_08415 [Lentisphaeria bacterium]|nr:hypothetical protein [Lentisphaeria bacterium]